MRKLTVLLTLIVMSIVGIAAGTSTNFRNAPPIISPQQQSIVKTADPLGTIDGAKNPELIPDRVAYTLLFRLIANRQTDVEKNRIRAYIRQLGFGNTDINALLAVAEEFQQRVGLLDQQAKEIKDRSRINPNPMMAVQLILLQQRKEVIVDELLASLPHRMSADGIEKVRQHINEHVKRNVKLGPAHSPQ